MHLRGADGFCLASLINLGYHSGTVRAVPDVG